MGLKVSKLKMLNIGTSAYAVHKNYIDQNIGGRIVVCRIKTFENKRGTTVPVLTEVGNSKRELSSEAYYIYYDIDEALYAIIPNKKKSKKS